MTTATATEEAVPVGGQKAEASAAKDKVRSETAYPYYGLTNAIGIVEAVRRAGGKEALSADVMREMGVAKATDRNWAYGIPGAIQFGLVERIGRGETGRIKVTDLGLRVVLASSPDVERAAKIAAFRKPELYTSLLERFAGAPLPSKEGLRNLLYTDYKIVESMAPIAAEAFIDSVKVAGLVNANNVISAEGSGAPAEDSQNKPPSKNDAPGSTGAAGTQASTKTITVPGDFVIYKCKIGKGRVIDIPLPPKFTTSDVKKLHAFLETQVDDDDANDGGVAK